MTETTETTETTMKTSLLQSILTLSENRIRFLRERGNEGFYRGSQTFYDGILDEMQEVKVEMDANKQVFLEDELGDVFWDFICLLENLEQE